MAEPRTPDAELAQLTVMLDAMAIEMGQDPRIVRYQMGIQRMARLARIRAQLARERRIPENRVPDGAVFARAYDEVELEYAAMVRANWTRVH